jgi:hypothetical protein
MGAVAGRIASVLSAEEIVTSMVSEAVAAVHAANASISAKL